MLRKFKIPVIVLVTVLLNQAAGYAVHAAVPESFRPSGTTRYAVASATDLVSVAGGGTFENMPGMSTSITIPAGKRGDIMILFCGASYADAESGNIYVQAMVGSSVATPGPVDFYDGPIEVASHCATFYKLNKPEGTANVRMQWYENTPTVTAYMWHYRTMIVTVNIHD